ncbi:MAG: hypothetical protein ABI604_03165 [Nitrospirota bacterium]
MKRKLPQPSTLKADQSIPPKRATRFRMGCLLAGVLITGVLLSLFVIGVLPPPHKLTPTEKEVLSHYEIIRFALAHDDLAKARKAASELANTGGDRKHITTPATALGQSTSLEAARIQFKTLSAEAVRLASSQTGYYIMACEIYHCSEPCLNCPMSEFGKWVQVSSTAENPFMGKEHSRCGTVAR